MALLFGLVLLATFVRDVQAASLLSSGGHELAIASGLPVTRPVSEVVPPVEQPSAADPAPDVTPVPAPVAGVALPLGVTFPVEASEEEAPDLAEPVAASPSPPEEGLGEYLGSFKVTCYALKGITFSGAPVALDGVAVDPAVIAIGASMYIDGLGWKVARDTGRLIVDKTIDIWNPSRDWCIQWGVQYLDVWAAPE